MPVNNYLVIGVNPTNNETTVPLNKEIVVTFGKHMNLDTLTPATLILKEVNGPIVPYKMTYVNITMTARLTPEQDLKPGTQYQLQIVGTSNGVQSITGDYLGASRSFEFTTSYQVLLSPPTNLSVVVTDGYPSLQWGVPADYDTAQALLYEAQIGVSNTEDMMTIWPSVGDINKTGATVLNVPKKLAEGNYYAYVRALNGDNVSDWAMFQFYIESPVQVPTPVNPTPTPGGSTGGGGGDIFSFDVVDVYPRKDEVDIMPENIIIVFDSEVDPKTLTEESIYVIKKEDKANLTLIDFMTTYSPSNRVPLGKVVEEEPVEELPTDETPEEPVVEEPTEPPVEGEPSEEEPTEEIPEESSEETPELPVEGEEIVLDALADEESVEDDNTTTDPVENPIEGETPAETPEEPTEETGDPVTEPEEPIDGEEPVEGLEEPVEEPTVLPTGIILAAPNVLTLEVELENDAEYTIIIRDSVKNTSGGSLGGVYHWSFVTKYSRLYGDAKKVRQEIGSLSDNISDKVLYQFMSDSTEYTYQLLQNMPTFDANLYEEGAAPYEVHEYVRLRTAYNLLLNSQLFASNDAFTTDVTLGDLKVVKEAGGAMELTKMMTDLKNRMKVMMDLMQGHHNRGYAKPVAVSRGENIEAYPDFLTRAEYKELGQ